VKEEGKSRKEQRGKKGGLEKTKAPGKGVGGREKGNGTKLLFQGKCKD